MINNFAFITNHFHTNGGYDNLLLLLVQIHVTSDSKWFTRHEWFKLIEIILIAVIHPICWFVIPNIIPLHNI